MIIAILGPFRSKVTVSEPVQETFDYIETLDSTSVVMVSFDFESSSFPEMKPLATALLEHLFRRKVNLEVGLDCRFLKVIDACVCRL